MPSRPSRRGLIALKPDGVKICARWLERARCEKPIDYSGKQHAKGDVDDDT